MTEFWARLRNIPRSDYRDLLIFVTVAALGTLAYFGGKEILPWYRITSIISLLVAVVAGISSVYRAVCTLRRPRLLDRLEASLHEFQHSPGETLLDMNAFNAAAFHDRNRTVFFLTELHVQGVHWIDIVYFHLLSVFAKHGFQVNILITERALEPELTQANIHRYLKSTSTVAKKIIGRRCAVRSLKGTRFNRASAEIMFNSIDATIQAMEGESPDFLRSRPGLAATSLLWSMYLASWSAKYRRPFAYLQWQNTAHRYSWLEIALDCQAVVFKDVPFVRKPQGPYLSCTTPLASVRSLLEWMEGLTNLQRNVIATLLTGAKVGIRETWNKRSSRIIKAAPSYYELALNATTLFGSNQDPKSVSNERTEDMLGWLLAARLQHLLETFQADIDESH